MGFFSRKTTTSGGSDSSANIKNGVGILLSSEGYIPPVEGGSGDVTITNSFEICMPRTCSSQLQYPHPIGYKMETAGDGSDYVNADLVTSETDAHNSDKLVGGKGDNDKEEGEANIIITQAVVKEEEEEAGLPQQIGELEFNGIKGVAQAPKYKDLKYFVLFLLHFGITVWWFVASCIPTYTYYNNVKYGSLTVNHIPLIGVMLSLSLVGISISIVAVGYFLRHGQTALKSTIFFSMCMCLGVGVFGLFMGEMFMCMAGLIAFAIVSIYANMIWKRITFTAIHLSVAISSIRENMGLILAALQVCGIGCLWVLIASIACVYAYKTYGSWSLLYFIFSFYWTQQVLSNVVSVATAGNIGRWFVIGESSPDLNTGLRDTLMRARSYSFGSICVESLFFGLHQMAHGLSTFLSSLNIPILPRIFNGITWCISKITNINEWTFVYIGLYGYSYTTAERNITTLFKNNDMGAMLRKKYAGNILFMSNMTIGLLSGVCGMIFATFGYKMWRRAGMPNPILDGFLVGFVAGFLNASIILSVVTATMRTLIVCFAESPAELKANHPELIERMESAWKICDSEDNNPQNKVSQLSVAKLLKNRSKGSFLDSLKGKETTRSIV